VLLEHSTEENIWKWQEAGEESIGKKFITCTLNQVLVRWWRKLRCEGHVARMGETRNANKILVGEPEVRRPLGRPRRTECKI